MRLFCCYTYLIFLNIYVYYHTFYSVARQKKRKVIWGGAKSASATNLDKWIENGKHAGGLGQYFSAHLPNTIYLLLTDALICTENLDLPHIIHSTAYDITGNGKEELFLYIETTLEHYDNKGSFYMFSPKEDSGYFLLAENHNFRAGFTEILAYDGTVLLRIIMTLPFIPITIPLMKAGGNKAAHILHTKEKAVLASPTGWR